MSYRKLIPYICIKDGKAVRWMDDWTVVAEDVVALAKGYNDKGADELLVFDLSESDDEQEEAINLIRKIKRAIRIPIVAGGNIKRFEDAKKLLYAGAKRVIINLSKTSGAMVLEEASKRFGKEKILVSLMDFDTLFKQQELIEAFAGEMLFMKCPDLTSITDITAMPCIVITDATKESEVVKILKSPAIHGISGIYLSQSDTSLRALKEACVQEDIKMTALEGTMAFSEFKLNEDGLLPVIAQDYTTGEVLMLAYMDEDAFEHTMKTGTMTYYSRSRKERWIKGETSGHYQYVKSLVIDCDKDTLLAKVDQVGAACHTGNATCFYQTFAGAETEDANPLKVFERVYDTILDRKKNPKEGSYTNYLFDKGIDKILKKVGEEATELVIAAKNPNPEEIKYELSDFLYHAMVLMVERGVTWDDIVTELAER